LESLELESLDLESPDFESPLLESEGFVSPDFSDEEDELPSPGFSPEAGDPLFFA